LLKVDQICDCHEEENGHNIDGTRTTTSSTVYSGFNYGARGTSS